MKIPKTLLLIALLFAVMSCSKTFKVDKTETDSVTSVPSEDVGMNQIIEDARKTVSVFIEAMRNPADDESDFQVKYPFTTDPGSKSAIEHIWLSDIVLKGDVYFATVGNEPFYIAKMKMGDQVEFDIKQVSDWMYFKGNKIIGGKSIRYLIENIPEKDRDEDMKIMYQMFDQ